MVNIIIVVVVIILGILIFLVGKAIIKFIIEYASFQDIFTGILILALAFEFIRLFERYNH